MSPFRLGHRPGLDGVRGLAIALVLATHSWYLWPSDLFNGGFEGVDLFFVLSGFLITSLLLEEHMRVGRISLRSFYRRRALRLFPALYLMLAVALFASRTIHPVASSYSVGEELGAVGATVAYVYNWIYPFVPHFTGWGFDQVWSLGVEEQFYLFWPLLLIVLLRWRPRWVGIVALTIGLVSFAGGAGVWLLTQNRNDVYYPTTSRLIGLMIGAAIAWALHRGLRLGRWATPLAMAGLGFILWLLRYGSVVDGWLYLWGGAVLSIACAALVVGCLEPGQPLARVFSFGPARYLGRVSYSLYLWHYLAISIVVAVLPKVAPDGKVAVAYGAALAISVGCYHLVERPFVRLAHRQSVYQGLVGASSAVRASARSETDAQEEFMRRT